MEEILASIRRIISEDDPPAETEAEAAAPAAAASPAPAPSAALAEDDDEEPLVLEDEVVELTDTDDVMDLDITPQIDDLEVLPPTARAYDPPPSGPPPAYDEPLVSRPQATAAASAFDALERSVMMPPGGRSLEDVVREMLRPMLKAWLDENLPSIVEAQVAAEVERIARQRR